MRIPQGIEKESIRCDVENGLLAITGRKAAIEDSQKRNIPIGQRQPQQQQAVTQKEETKPGK